MAFDLNKIAERAVTAGAETAIAKSREVLATPRTVRGLRSNVSAAPNATGKLSKSFRFGVKLTSNGPVALVLSAEYGIYLDRGRLPGRRPPASAIEAWLNARNIGERDKRKGIAFAIARVIGLRGTAPPPVNFIQPAIDAARITMVDTLTVDTSEQLRFEFVRLLEPLTNRR